MRLIISFFFLVSLLVFFGCKPKYGEHEVVFTAVDNKASDNVYISFLTKQIEQFPEEESNYIKLSDILEARNEASKAIELLQKGEEENPESVAILTELSAYHLVENDIEKLSSYLSKLEKISPDNMNFLKLSAGYSLLVHDYVNALFYVNRAILANPFDDENHYLRGRAQLIHRDSLNALISFEEAYKLNNSYKNFAEIFDINLALGNLDDAYKYLEEIRSYKSDEELCYELGAYFNEVGEIDAARMMLIKCFADNSNETRINLELAKIYYKKNDMDSTLFFVNQYLSSNPEVIGGYILKARALEKKNYFTEARKLYLSVLEIDSTSILASKGLDNLNRKVAYLRLVKRKEDVQRQAETLKPLNSKKIK